EFRRVLFRSGHRAGAAVDLYGGHDGRGLFGTPGGSERDGAPGRQRRSGRGCHAHHTPRVTSDSADRRSGKERMMTNTKAWYLSRTIWAALATIATAVGGFLGLPTADLDSGQLTDALLQRITAISGIVAIFGRLSADSRIG